MKKFSNIVPNTGTKIDLSKDNKTHLDLDEFDFPEGKHPSKEDKPIIFCKGKCNHEMTGIGENGGPIIQCISCKRTFGDI